MKKNTTMRIAGILVVLTLITSCFVGGTFAKYVSAGTATDTARVAKWGVQITSTGSMFSKTYKTHDDTLTTEEAAIVGLNSVISSGAINGIEKVVAPGTDGKVGSFDITGTPEVAVRVEYTINEMTLANWTLADNSFYCPIVFVIGDTEVCGLDYTDAAGFKTAVEEACAAESKVFAANTDLSTVSDADLEFSWRWDFEGATVDGDGHADQTDENDTYLGDQAAEGNPGTIELDVSLRATQID